MRIVRGLFALLLAPSTLVAASLPEKLIGTWIVDRASVKNLGLPPSCESIRVRYEPSGETLNESGGLSYRSKSRARDAENGLEVTTEPYQNNGKSNCQGLSAEYFFSHYAATSHVEIDGNLMRFYVLSKNDGRFLLYKRL